MGGDLESRCVGRVTVRMAHGAWHHPHRTHDSSNTMYIMLDSVYVTMYYPQDCILIWIYRMQINYITLNSQQLLFVTLFMLTVC